MVELNDAAKAYMQRQGFEDIVLTVEEITS